MENTSQEVQIGSLIDLSPEEMDKALATTICSSTPLPGGPKATKIDGLTRAIEALASRIEERDTQLACRLDDVTQRLETIENPRQNRGKSSREDFADISSSKHGFAQDQEPDELMRALEEIESRIRTPQQTAARKRTVKPSPFDGQSSWEDYLAQFSLVAELNEWDSVTKATYLAVNLSGPAREVLGDLSPTQRKDFAELTQALSMRFGTENRSEMYRATLKSLARKRNESLPELAQSIRRMTKNAYPQAPADVREVLAKDTFVDALDDTDTKWKIRQARPRTLNQALDIAVELEAFQLACKRTTPQTRTVQPSESTMDLAKQLAELKEQMKQFQNRPNRGREGCFTCGALDHFRRDCPTASQKQQQRRGNRRPQQPSGQQQEQSQLQKEQHNHQTSQQPQPLPRQHLPTNQVPSGNANLPGSRA